ncbi:probable JmjC domain-containing histone demethylation protein 2C [Stegostoma tigrinum]|uniref:probable JmjC domain-containing histone demethylation protein 2C n=1 Tax=Stegostoma tigrinum TaxID=3053191 RepID=UPI00202B36B2|nr:probable JmjC domain-containing histone demethylation protein 2C [Stegostoma tigrinum]
MAPGPRTELVGKRFVCVGDSGRELDVSRIHEWHWRAGVIRALSYREPSNRELSVYVEFDDLEWEKREWVKVYEDFKIFLVEHQLVWAKRKNPNQTQGSKSKQIQWPALTFKSVVGKAVLHLLIAIEFFVDKQLNFIPGDSAFQLYQDDVDSLSPVLRDNPPLHEEVKAWVKEQKVQEIFMQGPYSLNGYRVRVYRQDSATQWFTGIITYHDLLSRTMIVMNDQVLEPQNVDPSMVQMTFLDDVVHSLLKGENIGITSRRRSRSNQNNPAIHGHYTRAQANSPRPVMNSQTTSGKQNQHHQRIIHSNKRKESDSSVPDEDKIKEDKCENPLKEESSKNKIKQSVNKRRKQEEVEKLVTLERLKAVSNSDTESSESENSSNKVILDSSSEKSSEGELKNKIASDNTKDEAKSQDDTGTGEQMEIDSSSPCDEKQEVKNDNGIQKPEHFDVHIDPPRAEFGQQQSIKSKEISQGCIVKVKTTSESLSLESLPATTQKPSVQNSVSDISNRTLPDNLLNKNANIHSPGLTSRNLEMNISTAVHLIVNQRASDIQKSEAELHLNKSIINEDKSRANEFLTVMEANNRSEKEKSASSLGQEPSVPNKNSKPNKTNTSPDALKPKITYPCSPAACITKPTSRCKNDSRSSLQHLGPRTVMETTKSPLIVDKNERFTVYRDPALVGPDTGAKSLSPYLHPHLHPLHTSSHSSSLTTNSSHPALRAASHHVSGAPRTSVSSSAHILSSGSPHSVHSTHHLPTVLPGVPPGPLVCGHLDSVHVRNLNPLTLAHHQQFLQQQSSQLLGQTHPPAYNQLGLYPIIWQYPNGTHLSPGLSMTSSKWVHPENSLSAEASLRRNASSPWLPQHTSVSSADSLGLLSHNPVRPASADPHRPLKLASHSSPPLSKTTVAPKKEEFDKKTGVNSKHYVSPAQMKLEFNHDRLAHGRECQLARGFTSTAFCQSKEKRSMQEPSDSQNKYNEERRRILQESIEVARFASSIKTNEVAKDACSRIPSLPTDGPKQQSIKQDSEHCARELYTSKNSLAHSVPQSNYFTTLSNSVVNEPPRLYLSKDIIYPYAEKTNPSTPILSSNKTLSKPPPLIKHQPESEGLVGKATEQFTQQVTSQPQSANNNDHGKTREQLTILQSNPLKSMPSLHRAPVYHPPSHHVIERKEGNYRNLSPPTLTPIQPVNAAKISELQKPPTLLPEPRVDGKICIHNPAVSSLDVWKSGVGNLGKPVCHLEKSNNKVAPASVIVRSSCISKQENKGDSQTNSQDSLRGSVLMPSNPVEHLNSSKVKDVWRINTPGVNLDCTSAAYEKNLKVLLSDNGTKSVVASNSLCNSMTYPADPATTVEILNSSETKITYCSSYKMITNSVGGQVIPKTSTHFGTQTQECKVKATSAAVFSTAVARTGNTTQNNTGASSTTDYYQLKKHKAALAMAHSASTPANNNESASLKCVKSASSLSPNNTGKLDVSYKTSSVTNGQIAQSSQPGYHTKLKKAWLTRHSEEDKNTNKVENTENTVKDAKKLVIVNSSASISNDVDKTGQSEELKNEQEGRKTRRGTKRMYESGSESDASDESENKSELRVKRQPKPTYKKRQNDLQKRKADTEREEEEVKPNGTLYRNIKEKEKNKIKLQSDGLPRSVLKDWRKVKKLKQTGESFLQDGSCSEIAPNLQKCRECRMVRYRKNEESSQSAVFCRFYYFRRLAFSKNAVLRIDGFSTPDQCDEEAISLWLPSDSMDLDLESSKYILRNIGDTFCQIETSERTAMSWLKLDAKIAWKRAVKGVQEMCDACEATLFNMHWVCQKCGFVVCLDCYEARGRRGSKANKELYVWLKCVKGQVHDTKNLMPTQIIPSTVLTDIGEMMRSFKASWGIAPHDPSTSEQSMQIAKLCTTNGVSQSILNQNTIISMAKQPSACENAKTNGSSNSPQKDITTEKTKELPVSKAVKIKLSQIDKTEDCKTTAVCVSNEHGSTLRDLLTSTAGKLQLGSTDAGIAFAPVFSAGTHSGGGARSMPNLLDDIIASVVENKIPASKSVKLSGKEETKLNSQEAKILNTETISKSHPEIPHSWLCDGFLLWLQDPKNPSNWKIFRECWRRNQPVLVSGVHKNLNSNFWKPESFCEEFGDQKVDLVNCKDGSIISSTRIQDFWDGFEDLTKRTKCKNGESMLLKMKDWPSGDDFRTMMPSRFDDLMKNLPLPEYCDPEGNLNLASRIPDFFVRPDLGPKLYGAYGQSTVKEYGTTNLHLDIADVVNVLVYVGVPKGNGNNYRSAILKKIEEDEIDETTKKRLQDVNETPGALWHVFSAKDTHKIKEFLQKTHEEQGQESPDHDLIRDQTCYLNKKLRRRLSEECGIRSWSIFQFLGDAVLVPAGALRQMQSIYSCIQVSEDFVSPEHTMQSFHLSQELRHQSRHELNYEDKLQVKNIIYHSVKDAVGSLRMHEEKVSHTSQNA